MIWIIGFVVLMVFGVMAIGLITLQERLYGKNDEIARLSKELKHAKSYLSGLVHGAILTAVNDNESLAYEMLDPVTCARDVCQPLRCELLDEGTRIAVLVYFMREDVRHDVMRVGINLASSCSMHMRTGADEDTYFKPDEVDVLLRDATFYLRDFSYGDYFRAEPVEKHFVRAAAA